MRPEPITVSQLNSHIKALVDDDEWLNNVYIKGEVSNFKKHYTGHIYFTLKDDTSLIKCIMFKSYASNLLFEPDDGMSVVILGTVSVFERDGAYQLYAKGMEPDGMGALYKAFEQLKGKLEKEGLFNDNNKKPIPLLPKAIGIATSSTGAVIRDIINVTTRRFPNVNLKLIPVAVQGKGASETIVEAIKKFNVLNNVDVIIIARGGGSLEDLWPFNEEITARAIYESKIPIISAVGHETDFTIADFVADLRAPTPSAAGELAVPNIDETIWKVQVIKRRLSLSLKKKVDEMKNRYIRVISSKVFKEPLDRVHQSIILVDNFSRRIENKTRMEIKNFQISLVELASKLDSLSPLKTLTRGYCIVEDKAGKIVKSKKNINKDDEVKIVLSDGNAIAKII